MVLRRVSRTVGRAARGIRSAIRVHRRIFVAVTLAVFLLNLLLPPVMLSVVRKPWDHFSFNPWLRNLPAWLASDEASLSRKLTFPIDAALYWFIADSPYDAPEWGYTVTVRDVLRWLLISLLFGAYFVLWSHRRGQLRAYPPRLAGKGGGRAGVAGAFMSTLGFSTMPCGVVGCGAPVLPVLGLALTGLSSVTLSWIYVVSRALTTAVLLGVSAGVVYLGLLVTAQAHESRGIVAEGPTVRPSTPAVSPP